MFVYKMCHRSSIFHFQCGSTTTQPICGNFDPKTTSAAGTEEPEIKILVPNNCSCIGIDVFRCWDTVSACHTYNIMYVSHHKCIWYDLSLPLALSTRKKMGADTVFAIDSWCYVFVYRVWPYRSPPPRSTFCNASCDCLILFKHFHHR